MFGNKIVEKEEQGHMQVLTHFAQNLLKSNAVIKFRSV